MSDYRLPTLLIPTEEAGDQIEERVRKGEQLRDRKIAYSEDLEEARKEYQRWNTYNLDMLTRFFDTPGVADEYRHTPFESAILSLEPEPVEKRASDFRKGMDRKIHKLASIGDRLPLFSFHQFRRTAASAPNVVLGSLFITIPSADYDAEMRNVLMAIKLASMECGLEPIQIVNPDGNGPISPKILETLANAEFVVADLTHERPCVYFIAGFAEAMCNTPVYVARKGTKISFDPEDYSVIFYENNENLRAQLHERLQDLKEHGKKIPHDND